MKVFVTIYEHRYGTDVEVYRTLERAEQLMSDIAREYWSEKFPNEVMPVYEVGDSYFSLMSEQGGYTESFSITEHELEE